MRGEIAMKLLILAGYGIRLHNQIAAFRAFLDRTGLECVTTWTAADLLPTDHPQNIGIVGVSGQRGANKAMCEADLIYVLGASANIAQLSSAPPKAPRIVTHGEDLANFFKHTAEFDRDNPDIVTPWAAQYKALTAMPAEGSYDFNARMTRMLPPGCIMVVDGGGTALYTGFQSSHIKEGSRLICSTAISAMGSGLPEAVGACLAAGKRMTTCLIGDGSFMLNVQELATIAHYKLPITIFVLNNKGYLAIRHTQQGFMDSRFHGVDAKDMTMPDIRGIAHAFGIHYCKLTEPFEELMGVALDSAMPVICEVEVPADQKMVRQAFRSENGRMVAQALSEMDY